MKTITTQLVNCRDCHRCMRYCPVKAIGIEDGHARILKDKCILCGKCVIECPQQARRPENQLPDVSRWIAEGRKVVLSVAPSFVALFPEYDRKEFFRRLRMLGFHAVEETAVGAEAISQFYNSLLNTSGKPVISACCPVIVEAVKKYYPDLAGNLAPVISPMLAHAKMLKLKYGADATIVFAGPCVAKIAEAEAPESRVDAVITFEELQPWLAKVEPADGTEEEAPVPDEPGPGRYYPIAGGVLKSFMQREATDTDIIAVDGLAACFEMFEGLRSGEIAPRFIEALACEGGCINGPAGGGRLCTPAKRRKVTDFAVERKEIAGFPADLLLNRKIEVEPVLDITPDEARIRDVLRRTGKFSRQDEKNCGACGYDTCRDKAIAVCQGLTEIDTCVPYMRTKAESLANIIVDNSLNAVIVVNHKLEIQEFNPAAEMMFDRRKAEVKGTRLTELIDATAVLETMRTGVPGDSRVEFTARGLVVNQKTIPVTEHDLAIIVLTDVTSEERSRRELSEMKIQTVEKASEIITKQMQVAQEIAGLLGETTAETKGALLELIGLLKDKGEK